MFRKNDFTIKASLATLLLLMSACSFATSSNQPQVTQKSGVKLWADNCTRCHNMRLPDSYSDAQWEIAVLHMRVRANLAAEDARAITEYLKSAN